ncbi:O-methyltransferase [Clostridium oryzae]|uniref:tRNA 5-hydroxyuridine methyltransferase n=1 Tax=Clostridium oryzae TaxID=1450648 RepID=A0A1V4IUN3_9CLOT|nr:O-methyltransferase [Clostridium oryzae]OPJ63629.1 putative O-methyltransferase [Clostridium oryzae]
MSNITYDYMDNFIKSLVPEKQGFLAELEKSARENGVPIVQKEVANFLELMIKIVKPKKILELGTAVGYSALVMANAYDKIEKIDTIERNPEMIQQAEKNIAAANFSHVINIYEGDCMDIIKAFVEKYDIIFMDAGKGHYNHFLPECLRLLNDEGIIIADNALYKGMVASKELVVRRKITIVKRMKKYLELVNEDKNLITSVIPMGDGIAVTRRR